MILGGFLDGCGESEEFDFARGDEAIEAFDRAILLEPNYFEARLYKGIALKRACHSASARATLLDHLGPQYLGKEAALLYIRPFWKTFNGYLDRARDCFEAAIRLRPADSEPWYEKGLLLAGLSKDLGDEAIGAFVRATQLQPERSGAWYEWAQLLSERGAQDEALAHLRRAIAADATLRELARQDFPCYTEASL